MGEEIGRTRNVKGFRIHVTGSKFPAIVDEDVFYDASQLSWHIDSNGYPTTNEWIPEDKKVTGIRLHYFVFSRHDNLEEDDLIIFLNQDRLDCRYVNLAKSDKRGAAGMSKLSKLNKSGYKGVSWSKVVKKWVVTIGAGKTKRHLGCYVDKIDAAKAYDAAALKYYGPNAMTNRAMGLY